MLDECFDNHIVVILRFYVTLLTLLPPNTGMPEYPWGAEGSEGSLLSRYPLLSRALKHHPLLEKPDDIVMNIGIINTMAMTENKSPPAEPTENENQKASSSPSMKKGIRPKTVDRIVSITAIIL